MYVDGVSRSVFLTFLLQAIIDGGILTDRSLSRHEGDAQKEYKNNLDIRLSPESIAEVNQVSSLRWVLSTNIVTSRIFT